MAFLTIKVKFAMKKSIKLLSWTDWESSGDIKALDKDKGFDIVGVIIQQIRPVVGTNFNLS